MKDPGDHRDSESTVGRQLRGYLEVVTAALFGAGFGGDPVGDGGLVSGSPTQDPLTRLQSLVGKARTVPLSDQVRFSANEFYALIDAASELPGLDKRHRELLSQMERGARPVPLTGELRLPRDSTLDAIQEIQRSQTSP